MGLPGDTTRFATAPWPTGSATARRAAARGAGGRLRQHVFCGDAATRRARGRAAVKGSRAAEMGKTEHD